MDCSKSCKPNKISFYYFIFHFFFNSSTQELRNSRRQKIGPTFNLVETTVFYSKNRNMKKCLKKQIKWFVFSRRTSLRQITDDEKNAVGT